MITVGIADDEPLMRSGIRGVVEQATDIKVVAEAGNGPGAIELVRRQRPQVLLLDIRMPGMDGLEVAQMVRGVAPTTSVLLLTAWATDSHIQRALRAGTAGILLKAGNPRELIAAVRVVAAGDAVLSPSITRRVLDRVTNVNFELFEQARTLVNSLTVREKEVLELLANGMANLQIARRLYISEGAVKAHVSRLLTKLSCTNRVQAAVLAHTARLEHLEGPAILDDTGRSGRPRPVTELIRPVGPGRE